MSELESMQIGEMSLSRFINNKGKEALLLENRSGEVMEASEESLSGLLKKFFEENF